MRRQTRKKRVVQEGRGEGRVTQGIPPEKLENFGATNRKAKARGRGAMKIDDKTLCRQLELPRTGHQPRGYSMLRSH
eukprot:3431323-Pleurochrysis_carterae.AAC.2